jgi:hypothetical protein
VTLGCFSQPVWQEIQYLLALVAVQCGWEIAGRKGIAAETQMYDSHNQYYGT